MPLSIHCVTQHILPWLTRVDYFKNEHGLTLIVWLWSLFMSSSFFFLTADTLTFSSIKNCNITDSDWLAQFSLSAYRFHANWRWAWHLNLRSTNSLEVFFCGILSSKIHYSYTTLLLQELSVNAHNIFVREVSQNRFYIIPYTIFTIPGTKRMALVWSTGTAEQEKTCAWAMAQVKAVNS